MRSNKTMTRIFWLRNKCLGGGLLTSGVLSLSIAIAMTPLAFAGFEPSSTQSSPKQENIASNGTRFRGYNPPANPSSPTDSTSSTGTRGTRGTRNYRPPTNPSSPSDSGTTGTRGGCTGKTETTLTALAPYKHIGQTVSAHPTFAWFVPDSKSFPMEFRLYKYDGSGRRVLAQRIDLQSKPGIMTQSLPEDEPGLSVGQKYRWQVVIFCNPDEPSGDLVTEADIEVVEMSAQLKTALSNTTDPLERVNLYAEAGVWYNALSEALGTSESSSTREYVFSLLENLVRVEEPENSENASEQSEWLRRILAVERQQNSSRVP